MRAIHVVGHVWMLPVSAFGVAHAVLGARFSSLTSDGVLQFVAKPEGVLGRVMKRFRISAYTTGAVIVYATPAGPRSHRLYQHELAHVHQTMQLGPLMPVAYAACSLWQLLRGGHVYRDNWFERQARERELQPAPPLRVVR